MHETTMKMKGNLVYDSRLGCERSRVRSSEFPDHHWSVVLQISRKRFCVASSLPWNCLWYFLKRCGPMVTNSNRAVDGGMKTAFPNRLTVRIQGSHPWDRGSIPRSGVSTTNFQSLKIIILFNVTKLCTVQKGQSLVYCVDSCCLAQ